MVFQGLCRINTTFFYNDFNSFDKIISEHSDEIGVIMLELKSSGPENGFLEYIRDVADKIVVLIFDEVTSGFHNNFVNSFNIWS